MNHAELMALVVEREKKNQVWTTIRTDELKKLLEGYKEPVIEPMPWIGTIAA